MYFGSMLMAIGMTTVFTILALVVLGAKIMILITNKYAPIVEPTVVTRMSSARTESSKIAAITAVVDTITQGQGQIKEIIKSKD